MGRLRSRCGLRSRPDALAVRFTDLPGTLSRRMPPRFASRYINSKTSVVTAGTYKAVADASSCGSTLRAPRSAYVLPLSSDHRASRLRREASVLPSPPITATSYSVGESEWTTSATRSEKTPSCPPQSEGVSRNTSQSTRTPHRAHRPLSGRGAGAPFPMASLARSIRPVTASLNSLQESGRETQTRSEPYWRERSIGGSPCGFRSASAIHMRPYNRA